LQLGYLALGEQVGELVVGVAVKLAGVHGVRTGVGGLRDYLCFGSLFLGAAFFGKVLLSLVAQLYGVVFSGLWLRFLPSAFPARVLRLRASRLLRHLRRLYWYQV